MAGAAREEDRVTRVYRSPLRERQAEATKTRVCQAAAPLFAAQGYAGTSVREVAAAAGVSVETVYAAGGKAAVFLRSFELAFSGTPDGAPMLELDALAPTWASASLADLLLGMTTFIVESNERSAGLWAAYVQGATTDPGLASAYDQRMQDMRADGRRILEATVAKGLCALPADPEHTVDAIWLTLHPSQYVLLVTHARWTREHYQAWMLATVTALLDGGRPPT